MAEHTYPDPRVARLISEISIPVQISTSTDPGVKRRYHSHWTPCMMYFDVDDNEYRRSYGALNPDQFLAEFSLAYALSYLHSGVYARSVKLFEQAMEYTKNDPLRHAENMYWLGVANYRASNDPNYLDQFWTELISEHPGSDWAKKVAFIKD